ncbi:MAG: transcriptional regulator [Muribaculaceae bacterium]|nr:transcriptional regulator [Muribaculaceae bacterium]
MACSIEFIESICQILAPLGSVRSRKMMGDYLIYLNEKCVITACDNLAYIKKLDCLDELMSDAECGTPYDGAKEAYILNFSDKKKVLKVIGTLWDDLPFPKGKKKSKSSKTEV